VPLYLPSGAPSPVNGNIAASSANYFNSDNIISSLNRPVIVSREPISLSAEFQMP